VRVRVRRTFSAKQKIVLIFFDEAVGDLTRKINKVITGQKNNGTQHELVLRCGTCGQLQRDRRSCRDHLLREHHEVARRGFETPIRLEGRELNAVWAGIRRRQTSGMILAGRRREELGLPRVSDREAARRLQDNQARSARRLRAAARARGAATAALGTPVVPLAPLRWPSDWGRSNRGPWPCRPERFAMEGLACPVLPALGARRAPVRRQGTLARPSTRPRHPRVTICRPSVPRLLDALTPARPSGIRLQALLSCCGRGHSLSPRTTL